MKIYKIGDKITLPGAEDKIGLIVTGYERDENGKIWYQVAPDITEPFDNRKPVIEAHIEQ